MMLTHSVLDDCKNCQSNLLENLVKMLPKAPNKYSVNIIIKYDKHMLLGDYFNLKSVSENSFQTILKTTQVSKAAGPDNLSWRFLEDGRNFIETNYSL